MKSLVLINGIVLSLFLSTACAKTDTETETPPAGNADATSADQAVIPTATLPEEKDQIEFTDGMRIPIDGSSLESFERSLEIIKSKAEASEYTTLTGALDYLLLYDLGARRDRAKLAQRLDGQTGEQIVARVDWGKKAD